MVMEIWGKHSLPQYHRNQNSFDSFFGCRVREKGNGHVSIGEEKWEKD